MSQFDNKPAVAALNGKNFKMRVKHFNLVLPKKNENENVFTKSFLYFPF
jgi:hypothetical protein